MRRNLLPVVLAVLLLGACAFAAIQTDRLRDAQHSLEERQLQAISQSIEEMQSLTLSLEKLLISSHAARQAELLYAVALAAGDVQQCLSVLPAEDEAVVNTLTLMGRLQADAAALLPTLTQSAMTDADRRQFSDDLVTCTRLSSQLSLAKDASTTELSTYLAAEEYPLAEVHRPAAPRGLPDGEISRAEARQAARDFIGESEVASVADAPDVSGVLPAYGVTVQTGDLQLNMEVTRQGGKVLWMVPETASFSAAHTSDECILAALSFLQSHGFGETEAVHQQVYDGLCVISAAPLQDGVLLYPDLLTVQVRMDTLQVVGIEASAYWTNHVARTLPTPVLSESDAQQQLSSEVECTGVRLCLIPDGTAETLCWQCAVNRGGDIYYIYIDAQTGDEKAIRKVIPLENGSMAA